MKLQTKILLILSTLWFIICVGIYADSKFTLESSYKNLEHRLAVRDINRVQNAISNQLSALKLYTNSWSQWDDAYGFMAQKTEHFEQSNFVPGTFTSSNINFFLFFDTNGKFYAGRAYDLIKKQYMPVPEGLLGSLEAHPNFVINREDSSGNVGFVKVPEGIVVMSSLPVLTSDGKGPVRGSLLMGYFVTPEFFSTLSKTVNLKIDFFPIPLPSQNALLNKAYNYIVETKSVFVMPKDSHVSYGFAMVKDIDDNPIGMIQIQLSRDIYQEGLITTYHYLLIFIILGVVILITMMLLLKFLVLDRVANVSNQVIDLNTRGDFHKRLKCRGSDELSEMVVCINSMLELIETSQEQLRYRISKRTQELEKVGQLNRNLFKEMNKQRSVESKLREDEKILKQIAYFDSLTNLPNRLFFHELLQNELARSKGGNDKVALLFLDVDKFKKINDTYGHDFGDKFIKETAVRLKSAIREKDVAARLGGDEFLLLFPNITDKEMLDTLISHLFAALSEPFKLNNIFIQPTWSIGISLFPDDAKTLDDLMNQADLALYYAKKQDGNSFRYYGAIENLHSPNPNF